MRSWKTYWLLLVAIAFGCGEQKVVTVSGAVNSSGEYPHRLDWDVAKYLEAAGGYTQDAVIEEARLNRSEPDSANPKLSRQLRWPIEKAPQVIPGDLIWVPKRTYSVRIDTVKAVEDLSVSWKGNVYRVPKGYLSPGWTSVGVMTAVVIGDGTVAKEGGDETLARFQYLHVSMHPDEYATTFVNTGEVAKHREMLEDAKELHKVVMEKSAYKVEDKIERPLGGYVHVLAGVWPKPRNRTLPGSGMRKKKFGDGREWTTYSDGRQRMIHPDGRVVIDFPAGAKETRYPEGRVESVDASGNRSTIYPDGKRVVAYVDGNHETRYPDGRLVQKFATGTERTISSDGTERTRFADGTIHLKRPGGKVEIQVPRGVRETKHADGRVVATTAAGHEVTVFPDGRRFTRTKQGDTIEEYADGRKVQKGADGSTVQIFMDGSKRTLFKDGSVSFERADGSRRDTHADGTTVELMVNGTKVQTNSDGTVLEVFPDGREIQTDPNGSRLERFPDGRTLQADAAGNSIETLPDGMMIKTFVNAYRYWGRVQDSLIELEEVADKLSSGDSIVVEGTVPDSVESLMVAAFRVPDGVPVHARILREEDSFVATLVDSLLDVEGYYRLQIQASLPTRAVVVTDMEIKIGDPPDLGEMILDVQPFRSSDDAEVRVYDLVNLARTDLGLYALELDYALTEIAKAQVWEAVATGSFTHGVGREGAENVARGPSVEEVHTYMMMSVGHRSIILDRRFTKFGVAVADDRGQVWVVEVFDR